MDSKVWSFAMREEFAFTRTTHLQICRTKRALRPVVLSRTVPPIRTFLSAPAPLELLLRARISAAELRCSSQSCRQTAASAHLYRRDYHGCGAMPASRAAAQNSFPDALPRDRRPSAHAQYQN